MIMFKNPHHTILIIIIGRYFTILWKEVDVEYINNELMDFSNRQTDLMMQKTLGNVLRSSLQLCRCRKLPKALKEWPAFFALKKTIDDFNEV